MREAKHVDNHWCILRHYKRQTTVLSVMFVLVGMMFLVPAITGKAMANLVARADGKCGTTPCYLSFSNALVFAGKFSIPPTSGTVVNWSLHRTILTHFPFPIASGIDGIVAYRVGNVIAHLYFNSPFIGPNSCKVEFTPSVPGSHWACDKGSGLNPKYFYYFELPNTASGSGGGSSDSDSGGDNGEDSSGDNGDN